MLFFFFSSRRRHTRFDCDWSSDVCSSDLIIAPISGLIERTKFYEGRLISAQTDLLTVIHQVDPMNVVGSAPERYLLQRRQQLAAKNRERPHLYQLRGNLTFMDRSIYPDDGH